MNLLITNIQLKGWTGTETYVRELAAGAGRRGQRVMVYSPDLGPLADEVRRAGAAVVDRLTDLPARPDVIHAHHLAPTLAALRRFPDVPAIYVQHDSSSWYDRPPRSPQIRTYVAVDEPCRRRLLRLGIPIDLIRVQLHGVDLSRFQRRPPLPARPRRALVFSNYVARPEAELLRQVCAEEGIALDAAGERAGGPCRQPEKLLMEYDLVFAKGLCALEALAVGTAVILHHPGRLGPLVRSDEVDRLRPLNFGRSAMPLPVTLETIRQQLARYDAVDAMAVCQRLRREADLERAIAERLDLYAEAMLSPPTRMANAWLDRPSASLLSAWCRLRPVLRGWRGYGWLARRVHGWMGRT